MSDNDQIPAYPPGVDETMVMDAKAIAESLKSRTVQVVPNDPAYDLEYVQGKILQRMWRSSIAIFSRAQNATSVWTHVTTTTAETVNALWPHLAKDHEYRIIDLGLAEAFTDLELWLKSREPSVVTNDTDWDKLFRPFNSAEDSCQEVYGWAAGGIIELIHDLDFEIDTPVSKIFTRDSTVGEELQSLMMLGYLKALRDLYADGISMVKVFKVLRDHES